MGAQWKAKGKELAANARGRLFGKLAKEIMVAARNGADPACLLYTSPSPRDS